MEDSRPPLPPFTAESAASADDRTSTLA